MTALVCDWGRRIGPSHIEVEPCPDPPDTLVWLDDEEWGLNLCESHALELELVGVFHEGGT
jgi:hypothetical protein